MRKRRTSGWPASTNKSARLVASATVAIARTPPGPSQNRSRADSQTPQAPHSQPPVAPVSTSSGQWAPTAMRENATRPATPSTSSPARWRRPACGQASTMAAAATKAVVE